MSIEEKRFKKYSMELQYNQSELEFVKEILKKAHWQFEEYYRQYCEKEGVNLEKMNQENKEKIDKILPSPQKQDHDEKDTVAIKKIEFLDNTDMKCFKKLYREVVKKCHPDIGGDEVEFKRLARAHDEKDWATLLEICNKHNIKPKDLKEINGIMKKYIEQLKQKISREKSTYSWLLYECEDNVVCKDNVVKKFLKHLFDYGNYGR